VCLAPTVRGGVSGVERSPDVDAGSAAWSWLRNSRTPTGITPWNTYEMRIRAAELGSSYLRITQQGMSGAYDSSGACALSPMRSRAACRALTAPQGGR
jgi:hypothetical protein